MKCDVRLPYRMYVASLHFVFTLFGVSCRDNELVQVVGDAGWVRTPFRGLIYCIYIYIYIYINQPCSQVRLVIKNKTTGLRRCHTANTASRFAFSSSLFKNRCNFFYFSEE